jgi:hypothetical protein
MQVSWGDWDDYFALGKTSEWGSTEWVPALDQLERGDMVIAYQSNRNELVGVTKVARQRPRGDYSDLHLQPVEEIRTKVLPLKKASTKIAAIPALRPGPIQTVYSITAADAKLLLAAARKASLAVPS